MATTQSEAHFKRGFEWWGMQLAIGAAIGTELFNIFLADSCAALVAYHGTTQLADSCFLALSTSCPPTQGKVIDGVHRLEEMRY